MSNAPADVELSPVLILIIPDDADADTLVETKTSPEPDDSPIPEEICILPPPDIPEPDVTLTTPPEKPDPPSIDRAPVSPFTSLLEPTVIEMPPTDDTELPVEIAILPLWDEPTAVETYTDPLEP